MRLSCSLDPLSSSLDLAEDERIKKDLSDYIAGRVSLPQIASKLHKSSSRLSRNILAKFSSFLVTKAEGCFLYVKMVLDLVERGSLRIKSGSFKLVPQNLSEVYQLVFNIKFPSVSSYVPVSDIFSICLASLEPLTLEETFTVFSALSVRCEVSWAEFRALQQSVGDLLVQRRDGSLMVHHPTLRDWLVRRREARETDNKFLCDLRPGHAAIALSYSRQSQVLESDKVLGLAHHVLKSNIYKHLAGTSGTKCSHRQLQAYFTSLSADSLSSALASTRNLFSPITKVSRLLLLAGADPNTRTDQLESAPLVTVHSKLGHTEMVSLLLEYGAEVGLENGAGQTALCLASGEGHLETVQLLLQSGAVLGHQDLAGLTCLLRAARAGHLSVLETLMSDIPASDLPPLLTGLVTQAILHHQPTVTDTLLDLPQLGLDCKDSLSGLTPLEAAVSRGLTGLVRDLVKRGASLSGEVLLAAEHGHCEVTEYLVSEGAPLHTRDARGRSGLMLAASAGHLAVVEVLVGLGAELEDADQEGLTSLTHSVISGHTNITDWLLDRGADVNTVDNFNRSPLDVAIYQGQPAMVEILLDRGANMEHTDMKGIKPLDRVIAHGNTEILSVFLRKGAKLGSATWAMARGQEEIQVILLNKLLDDGNTLYRQQKMTEASHRYKYALKRLTGMEPGLEVRETFSELEMNLLLNLSRVERRQGRFLTALKLSSRVLETDPHCVQVGSS